MKFQRLFKTQFTNQSLFYHLRLSPFKHHFQFSSIYLAILVALILVCISTSTSQADKGGDDSGLQAQVAAASIPGSLFQINVYADGSVGLQKNNTNQFYAERASGVFLWAGNDVWGPTVPAGNSMSALTLVETGTLTGDGSATNPYRVAMKFSVGSTGLMLTQTITYVNGERSISFTWNLQNNGASQTVSLFHAADLYVDGNDYGGGFFDSRNRIIGGVNLESRYYGLFTPITPASAYEENGYSTIWSRIGYAGSQGTGFTYTVLPGNTSVDNGAGLQWNLGSLATGATVQIRDRFSIIPETTSGNTSVETPPPYLDGRYSRLPDLREFEFGQQVASSPSAYSSGDVSFSIPISRYYGDHRASTAYLTLSAFDVDSPAEDNVVRVNGHWVGRLTGVHNDWKQITLAFPSSYLNFPNTAINYTDAQYNTLPIPTSATLTPSANQITIDVDSQNRGYKTLVAWGTLYVGGVRPVLFSHGLDMSCNGKTRELGRWRTFLRDEGILGLGNLNDGSKSSFDQTSSMMDTYHEMQKLFGLRQMGQPGIAQTDKIILVGHSMGGLTGRRFITIAGGSAVANFATFGTPNAGSFLAESKLFLPGDTCDKPALENLTGNFVNNVFNPSYNLTNIWQPTSTSQVMSSIAARIRPSGPADGVVSNSSTHSLPYDHDVTYTYETDGYPGEPTGFMVMHTLIPELQSMYDLVKSEGNIGQIIDNHTLTLTSASSSEDSVTLRQQSEENISIQDTTPEFIPIQTASLSVVPGNSTTTNFLVDSLATLTTLIITDDASNLSYTLTSPSGQIHTPTTLDWEISNPEIGMWTATVSLSASASQTITLDFITAGTSDLTVTPTAVPFYVPIGQSGTFQVAIQDNGTPLTGLTVTGLLTDPNGSSTNVVLASGSTDGTYVTTYVPSISGNYSLDVQIVGNRADGTAFRRETALVATAIQGQMIDSTVSWQATDSDTDDLYNSLSATFQVVVPQAGDYVLDGSIGTQSQPAQFGANQTVNLSAGANAVTLTFTGESLGQFLTGDYYWLQQVRLLQSDGHILDWRESLNDSFYVDPALFQQPLLKGVVTSGVPIDTDADTLFDQLSFTAVITALRGGNYRLQATLTDANNQPFTFSEQGLYLYSGQNQVSIDFDGATIAANDVSGTFTLTDLTVTPLDSGFGTQDLRLTNSFKTTSLNIANFTQQVQLTLTANLLSVDGYVQIIPASADNTYSQGTQVELMPVFLGTPPTSWNWSVDGGTPVDASTLTLIMDSSHYVTFASTNEQKIFLPLILK